MGLWIGLDGNWDWLVFGCCFELVDLHMVGFAFWLGGMYFSPDSTCLGFCRVGAKSQELARILCFSLVLSMVLSRSADGKDICV